MLTGLLAWIIAAATNVGAHDPVFLTDEQTNPDIGPYFPDGTVSWAIYSSLHEAGQTRGFEFDLVEGNRLVVSLLIPNLEPEVSLGVEQLPTMAIEFPDGSVRQIEPEIGSVFDEPFSGTSYVRLYSSREDGMAGRHRAIVTARAPVRTSVAIGDREVFGTPAERVFGRSTAFGGSGAQIDAWYSTPPGEVDSSSAITTDQPTSSAATDGEVTAVDLTEEVSASVSTTEPISAAVEPAPIEAYLSGPEQEAATDRLLVPMTLLASALVILVVAKVVRNRTAANP